MRVTHVHTRGRCKCPLPCADETFAVVVWDNGNARGDIDEGAERSPMLDSEDDVITWQVAEHERRWARIHAMRLFK
jgi:hypothetical protein